jgi:hypothetical protein
MKTNFLERNHVVAVCPVAEVSDAGDLFDGAGATILNSDVMSLKNADGAVFILAVSANTSNGNASVRICACDTITPTTTVAVSFRYSAISAPDTIMASGEATSYLTSTAGDYVYIFEVDAAKVAEQGYEFVYFNADEVTNGGDSEGALVAFLTGLRYKEDDIGTQVT